MWKEAYEAVRDNMESDRVSEFSTTAHYVKLIHKIFRSFFVFQWLVRVYLLFTDIVHLVRPWVKEITIHDSKPVLLVLCHIAAIVLNGSALGIAYACGLKMNSYRPSYIGKAELTHEELVSCDREGKSVFTPRVPGTGLSISIETPGYMLGIILSVFGLVGALLAL